VIIVCDAELFNEYLGILSLESKCDVALALSELKYNEKVHTKCRLRLMIDFSLNITKQYDCDAAV
jgi:hypothetical protein